MHNALIKSIRDGQRSGAYLVVSSAAAERWRLHYSPFGCVEKSDTAPAIEARVIHDLSSPTGSSTNAWSDKDNIPKLVCEVVDIIANRIIALKKTNPSLLIKLMKGDVKSAYKNLHVYEGVSAYFAGSVPEEDAVVIDLALPFRSCADTTPFFCYDWADDHVLVEHDVGVRLEAYNSALRLAMVAVLGPRSINNKKFTEWSTTLVALGLEWDTIATTVSMPVAKIQKALWRIAAVLASTSTTRILQSKLLGSLRHVCSCIRPAKAFSQRLVALWKRSTQSQPIEITRAARLDLQWFAHILIHGRLRGVPLEYFNALPDPAVHLYMVASNIGLCVLDPSRREFIRLQFDTTEQHLIEQNEFSINVREQLSALMAVLSWGKRWQGTSHLALTHVRFWIDNTSAVPWCNNLSSTNRFAQEMNRILGAAEAEWGIRVSAGHLSGSSNFLADFGVPVSENIRKAYGGSWSPFNTAPWPTPRDGSTTIPGSNGPSSVVDSDVRLGYQNKIATQSLQLVFFAIDRWSAPNPNKKPSSVSSIHTQLSHVKWYHKVYAGSEPVISASHATAFGGMRRISPPPRPRTPVTMLEWMADRIDYKKPNHRLIFGAALVGFFYLLRSSEYLVVKGGRHKYALEVRHIEVYDTEENPAVNFADATHAVVTFSASKTDQQGKGTSRHLTRSGHPQVCPVFGAALLLDLAKQNKLRPTAPICSFSQTRMLKAEELSKILKAAAAGTGIDPSRVSCHSLRSGGASSQIARGVDSTTIKLHGRWKSHAFQRYTHYSKGVGAPLAALMAGKSNSTSRASSISHRNGVHIKRGYRAMAM